MAIDKQETKDSLFGNFKMAAKHLTSIKEANDNVKPEQILSKTSQLLNIDATPALSIYPPLPESTSKWQNFDKVTALLTAEQKEGLDRIAKKLMKHRARALKGIDEKERITANTILRALIENFIKHENTLILEILSSEEDVYRWVKEAFKKMKEE